MAGPSAGALLAWALLCAALGAALLGPVLDGGFFGDDWELYLARPAEHILGAFAEARPYEMYRPIQLSLVAISQTLFGRETTLPVHLVNLAAHAALAVLVLHALSRLGASRLGALLGALYLTVSQLCASPVGGNDTISLTLATLSGSLAVWLMSPYSTGRRSPLWAAAAYAFALWSKESSLGYLPLLCALAWLRWSDAADALRKLVAVTAGLVALTVLYLGARALSGGNTPDLAHGHQMGIGANIPANIALLSLAALVPVSTTWIYLDAAAHRWLWPALGGLSSLALVAFIALGLARAGRLRWVALWIAASAVVLSPVLPLLHVSELYAYAVLPFTALVFGWSAGTLLAASAPAGVRWAAAAFAGLVLLLNGWATHEDARGLARSGALARALMPQGVVRARALPPGGQLLLVDPPSTSRGYSVFQAAGFIVVNLTPRETLELTGRSDVRVLVVASGKPLPEPCSGCELLTLGPGDRIVPLERIP